MSANLAGAIFLLLGLGVSYYGYRLIRRARASSEWPAARGQIESSAVDVEKERERDSDGNVHYDTKYVPRIVYRYQVEGTDYYGEQLSYGSTSSGNASWAYRIRDQYPPGTEVSVYYDPGNPQEAVLQPGAKWTTYIVLGIGVLFALTGGLILTGIF